MIQIEMFTINGISVLYILYETAVLLNTSRDRPIELQNEQNTKKLLFPGYQGPANRYAFLKQNHCKKSRDTVHIKRFVLFKILTINPHLNYAPKRPL